MTGLWLITGAALVVAIAAWLKARRLAARLTQLSEMYWELKYQQLELRKQIEKLGKQGDTVEAVSADLRAPAAPATPKESFVPLTSLRR